VSASSETPAAEAQATLPEGVDLHARPAADFVRAAMKFSGPVWVGVGDREVDAKSLLSILALGAKGGTQLRLRAEGEQAGAALTALADCVVNLR
jgi:phosphocarrier protein HPr